MAAEGQGRQVDAEDPPAAAKSEVSADPNFAVVCAFVERFGASCGVQCPNIGDLQDMLESKGEVRHEWIIFQVKIGHVSSLVAVNQLPVLPLLYYF